ncbi:MAG: DUF3644 domain-containing protein [Dehalococcoidia bacterium]|nr:DUF3644 domain-containing protein [Dehalococcoidia bacterium]
MPRRSRAVSQHLENSRQAALAAIEHYNKPGVPFRTRTYVLLMNVAWTSLFHAVFVQQKRKPWYVKSGTGKGTRYEWVDGDPKHWDLAKCVTEYWAGDNPPARKNIEFFLGLRNKIEHRSHPELDPALYGECQAMLTNFEDILTTEFGGDMALSGELGVALQFSALRPKQQEEALRRFQGAALADIRDYIQTFRASLPPEVLESSQYALRVFLIPKAVNHPGSADLPVEFVPFDPQKPEEMEKLRRVTTLIREKQVPVASKGLLKPKQVVSRVQAGLPYKFTMDTHTRCWKHYTARPLGNSENPENTKSQFCIYDELAKSYGYTEAWVTYLCRKLADAQEYKAVTGKAPVPTLDPDPG